MSHSDTQNGGSGEHTAPPSQSDEQARSAAQLIERAQFRGMLYQPTGAEQGGERHAAVVALPDPDEGVESLDGLVVDLLQAQFTVLTVYWHQEPTYPEILAMLPGAIEFLCQLPAVDPDRIGVLGVELGADLAIRAASTDPQIASVLGFAPYLTMDVVESGLVARLRRRGTGNWKKLVEQIGSMAAVRKLAGRSVRIVYGINDDLIDVDGAIKGLHTAGMDEIVVTLEDAQHDGIITSAAAISMSRDWFAETL